MVRIDKMITENPISSFLTMIFLFSLTSFLLMLTVPDAHTPESSVGLPVWLIAIWSPTIAAILIWMTRRELLSKIKIAFFIPDFSWWILIAFAPLAIAAILLFIEIQKGNQIEWSNFELKFLFPLIFINLFLGPLGEELGWRAFLYPIIKDKYGWMASALLVGIIWAFWHAPLWIIDSPQSKIPFWAFTVNVILLSILMSMIYNHSQGSIIGAILLHLTFNVSLAVIDILESHKPGEYVMKSLYLYVPLVIILIVLHEINKPYNCISTTNI